MAAVFNFVPPPTTPFQFQPTLDGTVYNCTVTWNVYAQRWYLNVYTLQNVLVLSKALVGAWDGIALVVTGNYNRATGLVTLLLNRPVQASDLVAATLTGTGDIDQAGFGAGVVVNASGKTISYYVAPGLTFTIRGGSVTIATTLNLLFGYFNTIMVFRAATQTFEVS